MDTSQQDDAPTSQHLPPVPGRAPRIAQGLVTAFAACAGQGIGFSGAAAGTLPYQPVLDFLLLPTAFATAGYLVVAGVQRHTNVPTSPTAGPVVVTLGVLVSLVALGAYWLQQLSAYQF